MEGVGGAARRERGDHCVVEAFRHGHGRVAALALQRPAHRVARTDRVPFPQANITSVLAYRALRDMSQFEYAAARIANTAGGGPRRETGLRSLGAFVNRAPLAMSVLQNVG